MVEEVKEYFTCDKCGSQNFFTRNSFAILLKKVNFSEDLVYDHITEECYECKECGECINRGDIDDAIREIKRKYKNEGNIS
jgi:hypothetical protein